METIRLPREDARSLRETVRDYLALPDNGLERVIADIALGFPDVTREAIVAAIKHEAK